MNDCPFCGHENLVGADRCEECLMPLDVLEEPSHATPLERSLVQETIGTLGPKKAVTVAPDTSVREAVESMVRYNIGCVLVTKGERVVGIFSERDILLQLADRMDEVADQPVSRFMTAEPEILDTETALAFALNRMSLGDFRHLPLTRKGKLEGIVSLRDFLALVFRWYPDLGETQAST